MAFLETFWDSIVGRFLSRNVHGSYEPISTSGGGGLALESYQNSAMSEAVMAYVFRDEDDNICRVYEPIRNNDTRIKTYADKFPFDNTNCYDNTINDVDFQNFASDVTMIGNTIETATINANSHTGLILNLNVIKGNYGAHTPNLAEIFVSGNNVRIDGNTMGTGSIEDGDKATYIDDIGADSLITANDFGVNCSINAAGFSMTYFTLNTLTSSARLNLNSDLSSCQTNTFLSSIVTIWADVNVSNNQFNQECLVDVHSAITFSNIGANAMVDTTGGSLDRCDIGANTGFNTPFNPSGNLSNQTIININNGDYKLGVTGGAVTATAV